MHLTLDHHSGVPISQQITGQIKYLVVSGGLVPGERIPSVRALATRLRLNPTTVARVYRQLEAEGVIFTHPGRGAFIAGRPPGLTQAEQHRRLEGDIRRLLVEAGRLGVSFADLLRWIEEEIGQIEQLRDAR
ncbi:MAG TPA: GntR family transcriptional regulator [Candidatus Sumerlaeota bacterium]|nr:GntR family transcriptional regulator [Candidatus Sumerlaeota bacterium]HOR27753.1 GntR family transcriptional regulator [Candidatus Sumerlaeota bacterium]HPK01361.1 GntR family transcriptional regulator [Candidatus Sumerlaeota bacterium]